MLRRLLVAAGTAGGLVVIVVAVLVLLGTRHADAPAPPRPAASTTTTTTAPPPPVVLGRIAERAPDGQLAVREVQSDGASRVLGTQPPPALVALFDLAATSTGWSHVVPLGPLALLAYQQADGTASLQQVDDGGRTTGQTAIDRPLPDGATHVVAIGDDTVVLYDRVSGECDVVTLAGAVVRSVAGCSPGSGWATVTGVGRAAVFAGGTGVHRARGGVVPIGSDGRPGPFAEQQVGIETAAAVRLGDQHVLLAASDGHGFVVEVGTALLVGPPTMVGAGSLLAPI